MRTDLVLQLRLPSEAAWNLIRERFGLDTASGVSVVALGTLQHPDGDTLADSDGYHVDMIVPWSDVPRALRPYLVAPALPKHEFGGRAPDAIDDGELAPTSLADLASADLDALTPTADEAAEIAGKQRIADLDAAAARLTTRLAIVTKRRALEAVRGERDAAVAALAAAQAARQTAVDAIAAARAGRMVAVAERDTQQAIIDDPDATAAAKRDARDAKTVAVDEIARLNAEIDVQQTARDDALAVIAAQQVGRDTAAAALATLRAELDAMRAART